jgi:hypothetical protein
LLLQFVTSVPESNSDTKENMLKTGKNKGAFPKMRMPPALFVSFAIVWIFSFRKWPKG